MFHFSGVLQGLQTKKLFCPCFDYHTCIFHFWPLLAPEHDFINPPAWACLAPTSVRLGLNLASGFGLVWFSNSLTNGRSLIKFCCVRFVELISIVISFQHVDLSWSECLNCSSLSALFSFKLTWTQTETVNSVAAGLSIFTPPNLPRSRRHHSLCVYLCSGFTFTSSLFAGRVQTGLDILVNWRLVLCSSGTFSSGWLFRLI